VNKKQKPRRETGWDQLRQENERSYVPNFKPLRNVIRRNEFIGSLVELFVSAIVGVGKLNLGAKDSPDKDEPDALH